MSNHSQTAAAAMRREKSKSTKKPMALIFSDIQLPKLNMFSFLLKVKHLECLLVEGVSSALRKGGKI